MNLFNHFISVASFLLFTLAAYGIIGIFFNARAISPPNTFRGIWPLNEKPALVVLMVTQAGLVAASGFALIGVIRKSILIFYSPAFILLGIFSSLSIFGGVCVRESGRDISHQIFKAVQANANKSKEYFTWLSDFQWEHECCGVKSYMDWDLFHFGDLAQHSVPYSCCVRNILVPARNCGDGILTPSRAKAEIESIVFAKGCGRKISRQHSIILQWIGVEMLIVGSISLLVAAFLYFGVTKLNGGAATEEVAESGENGSRDRNGNEPGNPDHNAPPFSANRRQHRESAVSFAADVGNNNAVDRRVPRFRSARNSNPKAILRSSGAGAKVRTRTMRQTARKIAHQQHHSRRVYNPAMLELEAEMLLKPRDNHSILSTTPFPSDVHSFVNYFHKSKAKDQKPESGDSDMNLAHDKDKDKSRRTGIRALSHYSSLPQVYLVTPTSHPSSDTRTKALAELKQRIPPTFKNPAVYKLKSESHGSQAESTQPLSPFLARHSDDPPANQTLHTQHHHYYRIPSPSVAYLAAHGTFSSHDPIIPTTCSTIPEEPENVKSVSFRDPVEDIVLVSAAGTDSIESYLSPTQTTLSFPTDNISLEGFHPTIFEVFGTQSEPSVLENEAEFLGGSSNVCLTEPTQTMTSHQLPIPTGILDGMSGGLGPQENLIETNESKVDPDQPLDSILCFNM